MSRASLGAFAPAPAAPLPVDLEVPNPRGFIALLEAFRASGGTAPGEIVERLLAEHQIGNAGSLAWLLEARQIFGFEWRASLWIPMFQFDSGDLAPHAGAKQVRAELPPLWSGWAVAAWFAAANTHLAGCRPVDRLNSDLDAVLQAVDALEMVDEFVPYHLRRVHGPSLHV
ncbi:MAG: hypothetical protein IV107_12635 [Paucibacter sp.]|nr:hypothetical protein [Roseateles sp.]